MKYAKGDTVKYKGNSMRGRTRRNQLAIVTDSMNGRVEIQAVTRDGRRTATVCCKNGDVTRAQDDGRIEACLKAEAKARVAHQEWAEAYTALIKAIEQRHRLQPGQAHAIEDEVHRARIYLQAPPTGAWRP